MDATFRWHKEDDGSYTGLRGGEIVARLAKSGRHWHLSYRGQVVDLGTRATFNTAERRMGEIG